MKIKIQFKDPDGVSEAIRELAETQVSDIEGIDDEERESLLESKAEKIENEIRPWIKYGEYITVEIDTVNKTATVLNAT